MTGSIANPTQGARVPLRQRYVSSTSSRAVYRIPKLLGDSSGAGSKPIMAHTPEKESPAEPTRPVMLIWGEPFFVEREGEEYYIVHDRWSLMGAGKSLSEAYKDFLHMASVLAPVYARTPADQLDEDGTQLTKFLLRSR